MYNDRRTVATQPAIEARLKGYTVKTKSLGGGSHEVYVDGEHADTIHMGVDEDGRARTYAGEKTAQGWSLGRKSRALRHVVAHYDSRKHKTGMTTAHWNHVDGVS